MDTMRAAEPVGDTAAAIHVVGDRGEPRVQSSRYELALRVFAPWLRLLGFAVNEKAPSPSLVLAAAAVMADTPAAHDTGLATERWQAPSLTLSPELAVADQALTFAWTFAAPTAREHARPFAVGPPAHGHTTTLFCI